MSVLLRRWRDEGDGGGSADAGGDSGNGGTPPKKDGDKAFTQAELDAAVKAAVGDRIGRVKEKYSDYDATKTRLAELEEEAQLRSVKDAEGRQAYNEAIDLLKAGHQKELEKVQADAQKWQGLYKETAITKSITSVAAELGAINPEQVVKLVGDTVDLDATGKALFSDGSTVQDGVKAFLDANPYLVRANNRTGSGSQTGTTDGGGGAGKPLSQMTTAEEVRANRESVLAQLRESNTAPWAKKARREEKD